MSWYSLSSLINEGGNLHARFVPDTFIDQSEGPVLELVLIDPHDVDAATLALQRFRESFIVGFTSGPTTFSAFGEMDDEETTVHAGSVTTRLTGYSSDELLAIARSLSSMLQIESTHAMEQSRRIHDTTGFIRELIKRAELKDSMSTRTSDMFRAQIDILRRVLNRFDKPPA